MMTDPGPIRWVHRNPDDDVERVAQNLLRAARAETAGDAPAAVRERMWFRITSKLQPRPRRWLVPVGVTACLLVLAAFAVLLARSAPSAEARVVSQAGGVSVGKAGRWTRAHARQALPLPALVRVNAGARTKIALPRRAEVTVVGPASLELDENGYRLESGQSTSSVERGHGRFEVTLGRYRVVVHGTTFWTAHDGREAAVCLKEGAVDVLAGDVRVARLRPGHGWRSSTDAPSFPAGWPCVALPAPPGTTAAPRTDAVPEPVAPGPSPTPSERSAERVSTPRSGVSPEHELEELRPATALGTVGPRATDERGAVEPPSETPSSSLPLPERTSTPEVAPPPPPAPQPPPAPDRCRGAPDREHCYREVANGADLTAQRALYRLGELRRDGGDPRGALEAWVEYRHRFAAGAFAEETDLAILETRLRVRSPMARAAADRFLRQWPASPYVAEVHGIRGVLRQDSGDCAGALADYGLALGARISGARRDESLYGRAACLEALGRAVDARAAYERYLQDLPHGRFADRARAALRQAPDAAPAHE